jgi:hypothetical protein
MIRLQILLLASLVLVASGRDASAQSVPSSSPPDPVEDATIRFGPVGLNPAVIIRDVGPDNNVFNDSTNPKSDFTATISPRLEVLTHPGPLRFTYVTATDYVYYHTYRSESGTNFGNLFRADFDFGIFQPSVNASFGNTRDRLNHEIDTRARRRDQSYGAGLRVKLMDTLFASVGARQLQTEFDPDAEFRGQNLATTLNRTDDVFEASAGTALTPLTTVQVNVTHDRSRFEFTPERNSQTLRIMPMVTFSPLAMLNGTASVGYGGFTTQAAEVPDYHGLVALVTLAATLRERHRIDTSFARDIQYSYEETVAEYVETGLTVGWNWQVAGSVDTRLYGGRSRLHYRSPTLESGHTDDIAHDYGFSFGWRIGPFLRAGVNGDWRGRSSERSADRAFANRRVYATLTWGKVS